MKKIIFLDIDGVLATINEFNRNTEKFRSKNEWAERLQVPYPFNDKCVKVLNDILIETKAEIVLSSDWRRFWSLPQITEIFKQNGVSHAPVAVTGMKKDMFDLESTRVAEIMEWIETNRIQNWIVIDDMKLDTCVDEETRHRFVITDPWAGLRQSGKKNKIIKLLNTDNSVKTNEPNN